MTETIYLENHDENTIVATKTIMAPKSRVWEAWTNSELLDKWWAPKPWEAVTKSFEFREGGRWLYSMKGPEANLVWSLVEYMTIEPDHSFTATDAFSDELGNVNEELPTTHWEIVFNEVDGHTDLVVALKFRDIEAMKNLIDMGFKEGFAMGLSNLEELVSTT